jgi:MFS transporter, SP family, arabinose:H+ symporter
LAVPPQENTMNTHIWLWSITAALAGFLFGFDTAVISGTEQHIQSVWQLSAGMHGVAIASALYGTVLGSLLGGVPTDRMGRRRTLQLIGLFYLVGAVGSAVAPDVYSFIAARVLCGLGIGVSTVAAPLYIAEISPAKQRGLLAGMFQFNIVFGILVAYLSNSLLAAAVPHAWRWMLGVAAFPSLGFLLACLTIPESPRWLINRRHDAEGGRRVLRLIRPQASPREIEAEFEAIRDGALSRDRVDNFWNWKLRLPISLAVLIAFFNQLSGINAILYFAPRIFALTGLGPKAALLESTGVGVTNLVFTLIGLWLIDRLGRRTLLFIGSVGYITSLSLVSWAFFTAHYSIVPLCIFAFIAAHAVGQGAVIWVYISEIFPDRQRAAGQSLGSFTHWICAALLTSLFPTMVASIAPGYVFGFFAGMMVLQLVWVKVLVFETKGISLEGIQELKVA